MTVKELSRLFWLKKQIAEDEQKLGYLTKERDELYARLIDKRESMVGIGGQNMDGMPHAHGPSDRVGDAVVSVISIEQDIDRRTRCIDDLSRTIRAREDNLLVEQNKLEQFISTIDDPYTALIFSYRFVDCLSWPEVADKLETRVDSAAVRQTCYRYLRAWNTLHGISTAPVYPCKPRKAAHADRRSAGSPSA